MLTHSLPRLTRAATAMGPLLLAGAVAAQPATPERVAGLVAWYDTRTLYDKLRDGEAVTAWPDASGKGHDLTEEGRGLASTFRAKRVGDKPAVRLGKGSSFAVAQPFELGDHTIVLVHKGADPTAGLFSAFKNAQLGVIVGKNDQHHAVRAGTAEWSYGARGTGAAGFAITVLAREAGRLSARVDGVDIAAGERTDVTLEVGRLFLVELSRAVSRDANAFEVAELLFYDRALAADELRSIEEHLAEKYALALAAPAAAAAAAAEAPAAFDWSAAEPQLHMTAFAETDLNTSGLAVPWEAPHRIGKPFRVDERQPTRLYCEREARVHLSVRLRLDASDPGARLRILVLHNEGDWLQPETVTELDPAHTEAHRLTARLDVSLDMRAGDWVEVVASRDGAEGRVVPAGRESTLFAIAESR